jgi:enterochelin esterase family protein
VAASPVVGALVAELAAGAPAAEATHAFWTAVAARGAPVVEPDPDDPFGRIVTFLWRDRHGAGPGTRGVLLLANKLTDPTVEPESRLHRVPGTDVWHRGFRLASSWRGTYALAPDDEDAEPEDAALGPASRWSGTATRAQADPLNPHTFPGSRGGTTLSVLELPAAPPAPPLGRRSGTPAGEVLERVVDAGPDRRARRAWVHVPAGTGDVPHRLLVLLDGDEWAGRRDAPAILDALHRERAVEPLITVMVDGGTTTERWADMTAGAPYLDELTSDVPRWARARWPQLAPDGLLLAGQSLGGLVALRSALHAPDRVAGVVALSASLWWPGQESPRAPSPTVDDFAAAPPHDVRFHLEVGRDEWVLLDAHRRLHEVLAARGDDHALVEYEGGHDPVCWRVGLDAGLRNLVGRPG